MNLEVKHVVTPFEVKAVEDEGVFTGYGSVFGNVDSDLDIIAKGAFKKSLREWKKQKALPPVIWQHRYDEPIGPYTKMEEDDVGLLLEGQLLVNDVARAREARALLKSGAIRGLSVGFMTKNARAPRKNSDETEAGATRVITEVDLFEVSIVTGAANPKAQVSQIKSGMIDLKTIEGLKSLQELECVLREVGFSQKAATVFIAKCKRQSESVGAHSTDLKALADAFRKSAEQLKGI